MKINELQWDSHTTKKSLGKGLPLPTEKMERRRRRVLAAYCKHACEFNALCYASHAHAIAEKALTSILLHLRREQN
ncbi:hypothetical protein T4E_6759 [Trichinella pseudospiralis]|uniref:Uncharacterized protein n=1 Tax=Trichinella pseudospiralis TaxID=6337 RepID=A0A0V0XDW9_TRIPS|nr:hypothetical protein T4E_6759 [Trichinella pseudospiralis]